jgi:hypothetical protein
MSSCPNPADAPAATWPAGWLKYANIVPMSSASAKFGLDRFDCPRCTAFSHHKWSELRILARNGGGTQNYLAFGDSADSFSAVGDYLAALGSGSSDYAWNASTCSSCDQSAVWRGHRMVFPSESPISPAHPDMPDDAAELYNEARAVLPISRRAAAALARATLERLLRGLEGVESTKRLDELVAGVAGKVGESLEMTRSMPGTPKSSRCILTAMPQR